MAIGLSSLKSSHEEAGSSSRPNAQRVGSLQMIPEERSSSDLDDFSDVEILPFDGSKKQKRHSRKASCRTWSGRLRSIWMCSHRHCGARPYSIRSLICRLLKRPFWGLIMILGFLKFISLVGWGLVYLFPDDLDARLDAWVFPGGRPSVFSHWTTHGIVPVACHSHNDYWRRVPLHSAISAGCIGVEADIWLSGDDLLVGHTWHTLHQAATLRSLYLNPLLDLLQKHNTRSSRLEPSKSDGSDLAGVFSNDPSQTLALLIDFKADGEALWPYVVEQLEPLRSAGYLTHWNGSDLVQRPVTVVVTGDAPFDRVVENGTYRDIFFDAPLDRLGRRRVSLDSRPSPVPQSEAEKHPLVETDSLDYNYTNSYYASVDFRKTIGSLTQNRFSQGQLALIRAQVDAAHARGLKVRYWGTPSWPRGLRNHVWHVLVREGVDLINVDDLRDATRQDWRKHRSWLT